MSVQNIASLGKATFPSLFIMFCYDYKTWILRLTLNLNMWILV